tara:strand:+ start:48 stop:1370 length:1323 start_codon:yes stop_codon:yes gene_type:complete
MVIPVGKVLTKGAKVGIKAAKKGLTDIVDADAIAAKAADAVNLNKLKSSLTNINKKATPPPILNIEGIEARDNLLKDAGKWLLDHKKSFDEGTGKRGDFGKIIYNKQHSTLGGVSKFLGEYPHDVKKLYLRGPRADTRKLQIDPGKIDVANQWLESANAINKSNPKLGISSELLNPDSYRKGITQAGRQVREIVSKLRKISPELADIQQEHAFDLSKGKGTDDILTHHPGSGPQNLALNKKEIGGAAFDRAAGEALEIPGGGMLDKAASIKGTGPRATQRKAEYEQFGWLQSVTNRAMEAKATKGKGLKEANRILKEQKDAITKGDLMGLPLKIPGSKVTMTDMLLIQQIALKTGNPAAAAEKVIAERELLDFAIAQGWTQSEDALTLLKKYIKNIDLKMELEKAIKAGKPDKEYAFEGRPLGHYPKEKFTRLPSQATGK